MAEQTMRYLFLRIYSNDELQEYLNGMLQQDWVIDHCKGNFLFFRKQRMKNARICVATTECTQRSAKGDEQVDEYIGIALRKGWQLLCIGDFESVIPVRRRLYFYTQQPDVEPLEPDEAINFQYAYRAYHGTMRWIIIWSLIAAAALISTIAFMAQDGVHPVLLLIDAALLVLAASSVALFTDRRVLYRHVTKGMPMGNGTVKTLRRRESWMAGALAALFAGLVLLLFS